MGVLVDCTSFGQVNVDSNTVGWYQTTHLGQPGPEVLECEGCLVRFINKDVIHSQPGCPAVTA